MLDIVRIRKAVDAQGPRFIRRIYTENEISSFPGRKPTLHYALNFSFKESFWKTLPEGIQKRTYFRDIEIIWKREKPGILHFGTPVKNVSLIFAANNEIVMTAVIKRD